MVYICKRGDAPADRSLLTASIKAHAAIDSRPVVDTALRPYIEQKALQFTPWLHYYPDVPCKFTPKFIPSARTSSCIKR